MTVNERLFLSGLFDDFYEASKQRNREELESILQKVHLDSGNIETIIEHELSKK
jgi:hypothetical protein